MLVFLDTLLALFLRLLIFFIWAVAFGFATFFALKIGRRLATWVWKKVEPPPHEFVNVSLEKLQADGTLQEFMAEQGVQGLVMVCQPEDIAQLDEHCQMSGQSPPQFVSNALLLYIHCLEAEEGGRRIAEVQYEPDVHTGLPKEGTPMLYGILQLPGSGLTQKAPES